MHGVRDGFERVVFESCARAGAVRHPEPARSPGGLHRADALEHLRSGRGHDPHRPAGQFLLGQRAAAREPARGDHIYPVIAAQQTGEPSAHVLRAAVVPASIRSAGTSPEPRWSRSVASSAARRACRSAWPARAGARACARSPPPPGDDARLRPAEELVAREADDAAPAATLRRADGSSAGSPSRGPTRCRRSTGTPRSAPRAQSASISTCSVNPIDAEVRLVDPHQQRRLGPDGAPVVAQAGPVRGADLDQPRSRLLRRSPGCGTNRRSRPAARAR